MTKNKQGLREFAETTHLDMSDDNTMAKGMLEEYCFTACAKPFECQLTLYGKTALGDAEIKELLSGGKVIAAEYEKNMLKARLEGTALSMLELAAATQRLLAIARTAQLMPLCEYCGGHDKVALYKDGGEDHALCIACREKESSLEYDKHKNSEHGKDIKGALRGALIAFIAYVAAYQLGNVTAILGGLFGFCVVMGYQKYDGEFGGKSTGLCASICFVGIALAELTALWLMLYLENFWFGMSPLAALMLLPSFLSDTAVMRAALADLLYAYVPMLLVQLWWYLRQRKRKRRN